MSTEDNSQSSTVASNDVDQPHNNVVPDVVNHGHIEIEYKHGIGEEEARTIMEIIAATGKYWHDWNKLKSLLSFQLKQVLSEYAEAKMTVEEQKSSLGETYSELVKKLDEALSSFIEGPPFTLQRLCEILLDSRNIYSSLSKLALALEKNLLVTSTLTICANPYPSRVIQKPEHNDKGDEGPPLHIDSVQNGVEHARDDNDEVTTDAGGADAAEDEMTIDMEAFEDIVGSSESNHPVSTSSS